MITGVHIVAFCVCVGETLAVGVLDIEIWDPRSVGERPQPAESKKIAAHGKKPTLFI